MTNYQITKPLGSLPPTFPKTFKITSDKVIDFPRQYHVLCVGFKIHNHTGGTFEYCLNDEEDRLDLKSLEEGFDNMQIEKIRFFNVSDAELICQVIPIPVLKQYNALQVG